MKPRDVVERFTSGVARGDWESMEDLLHPDYTEIYPQSGEVIRGIENWRAVVSNYPGGLPHGEVDRTHGAEPTRTKVVTAATPIAMPIITLSGGDKNFTSEAHVEYPNGDRYHVVLIGELRGDKIAKATTYVVPPFDAPAWRAPYVERIGPD